MGEKRSGAKWLEKSFLMSCFGGNNFLDSWARKIWRKKSSIFLSPFFTIRNFVPASFTLSLRWTLLSSSRNWVVVKKHQVWVGVAKRSHKIKWKNTAFYFHIFDIICMLCRVQDIHFLEPSRLEGHMPVVFLDLSKYLWAWFCTAVITISEKVVLGISKYSQYDEPESIEKLWSGKTTTIAWRGTPRRSKITLL